MIVKKESDNINLDSNMVRFDFGVDIFKTKRFYTKYIPLPLLEPGLKTQRKSSVFEIINPCFNIFLYKLL